MIFWEFGQALAGDVNKYNILGWQLSVLWKYTN